MLTQFLVPILSLSDPYTRDSLALRSSRPYNPELIMVRHSSIHLVRVFLYGLLRNLIYKFDRSSAFRFLSQHLFRLGKYFTLLIAPYRLFYLLFSLFGLCAQVFWWESQW